MWRVRITPGPAYTAGLGLLSREERGRAARFRRESDRQAWVASRAALRRILGGITGQPPDRVHFTEGPFGKPALWGEGLQFNLSHSGEWALIAVAQGLEVGIDLEQRRPNLDYLQLARSVLSAREVAQLAAVTPDLLADAFFHVWACKEAFIKAVGEGVSFGLDRFSVSVEPTRPARLLEVTREGYLAEHWALQRIDVAPGYAAALAAPAGDWSTVLYEFPCDDCAPADHPQKL